MKVSKSCLSKIRRCLNNKALVVILSFHTHNTHIYNNNIFTIHNQILIFYHLKNETKEGILFKSKLNKNQNQ